MQSPLDDVRAGDAPLPDSIQRIVDPFPDALGDVYVGRLLPSRGLSAVGPVVRIGRIGPDYLEPGGSLQVGPHPHRGLGSLTYPIQGELEHRDSLGTDRLVTPGEFNWLSAGRGVSHSERSPRDVCENGGVLDGVELWCALPEELAEAEPFFEHRGADELPTAEGEGWFGRVLSGAAFGVEAPTKTGCGLFLADVTMAAGAGFEVRPECEEWAVLGAERVARIDDHELTESSLAVVQGDRAVRISADHGARVLLLGGPRLARTPELNDYFVAASREQLRRFEDERRRGLFPDVAHDPGDPPADLRESA